MTDTELDVALAERVMGWRVAQSGRGSTVAFTRDEFEHEQILATDHPWETVTWSPRTSLSDAWMLVEALRKRFRGVEVLGRKDGYCCLIEAGTNDVDEHYVGEADADSAPRAICLAAARAVGLTPEAK